MKTIQKIPEGWSIKKLGNVCKNKGQYGANAPAVSYSEDLPLYIRITDIDDDGKYLVSNRASVNISDYKNYLLNKGDIVFARTGATTGKTYLYNENDGQLVFAGFLIKFSPNTSLIEPYYLKLLTDIPIYKHWVSIMSVRSGQPGINAEEYAKYLLLLPPLPEQEKIAEILGCWDDGIEKLSRLIEQKKLLKKGLMQRLLSGKQRLPGFSEPWKKVKLGDFLTFQTGFPFDSKFFNQNGIGIRLIKNRDLKSDEQVYFYSGIYTRDNIVNNGDILVGMDGDFLPCLWKKGKALLNQRVGRVACSKKLNHMFAYYALSFPLAKLQNETASTTVKHLSHAGVLKIKTSITLNLFEQKAIADVLSKADEEIDLLTAKLSALKSQKKGLMQKLLTGQIRVKIPLVRHCERSEAIQESADNE